MLVLVSSLRSTRMLRLTFWRGPRRMLPQSLPGTGLRRLLLPCLLEPLSCGCLHALPLPLCREPLLGVRLFLELVPAAFFFFFFSSSFHLLLPQAPRRIACFPTPRFVASASLARACIDFCERATVGL